MRRGEVTERGEEAKVAGEDMVVVLCHSIMYKEQTRASRMGSRRTAGDRHFEMGRGGDWDLPRREIAGSRGCASFTAKRSD
jgi:hypothetical protein